ncbi:hypothetical protein GCM10010372_12700 [Streptomyces tauricus]|nr:hypothetical protein GCM10010372_12700 [Streptomyces tauricus]
MCSRTAGIVRGVRDIGYVRLGDGDGEAAGARALLSPVGRRVEGVPESPLGQSPTVSAAPATTATTPAPTSRGFLWTDAVPLRLRPFATDHSLSRALPKPSPCCPRRLYLRCEPKPRRPVPLSTVCPETLPYG